ncbi:hypothetical protein [Novosphingobium sp. M1R2S20]|uniref:Uncharacterized protein n=1 Tax=Novosphingobium rhizovicinum TaxID=3228928 RepID=A0ABV3RG26_9SPHN
MDGETITGSLDRIEAALQRIEAAARETENQARVTIESDSDLEQRHEDLRAAVTNALARLDTLLAEQEQ